MSNKILIESLNGILADGIVLYQKLHHYHWRVRGEGFFQLHSAFEKMYDQFAEVVDDVAERIVTIGGAPVPSLAKALELARVEEDESVPSGREMVAILAADMGAFRDALREAVSVAEEAGDRGSANLLDPIADELDKQLWMLDAYLNK